MLDPTSGNYGVHHDGWLLPEDVEPYDFQQASRDVIAKLPTEDQIAPYRKRDGGTDWLRFVRDKFESQMGYPEIMAFWQYLDERAVRQLPMASDVSAQRGIPKLKPNNLPKYIAGVAAAVAAGVIRQEEANALLYAAQLLIAAHKAMPTVPGKPRGRHARKPPQSELPTITAEVIEP
jgi:hypothetical protein